DESLRARPMTRITDPLGAMGATFRWMGDPGRLPVRIQSGEPLRPLDWSSPVASAQVKSALLLAGVTGGVFVLLTEPRRSRDHTERLLAQMGAPVISHAPGRGWRVELRDPPERLAPLDFRIPGDISSAAFLLTLTALGGAGTGIEIPDVGLNPTRTGFLDVLRRMGVPMSIGVENPEGETEPVGTISVARCDALRGADVGSAEVPGLIDELPLVAVMGTRAEGLTRITGAFELRHKESDRIRAMVENLRAVGASVEEMEDGLVVEGSDAPLVGHVRTLGDHRIAMAFGVLGQLPGNQITIDEPASADVSFPGFWTLLATAAGKGSTMSQGVRAGPVVTIDGPAGSGKSTTAREVARRLGLRHLDSGALYRGLTVALLEAGWPEDHWSELSEEELASLGLSLGSTEIGFEVRLGDRVLGPELRTEQVTNLASPLARLGAVRAVLLGVQRDAARMGGLVADGRDMGTVVFPDADVKVFLVAELGERARRRLLERTGRPPPPDEVSTEAEIIAARDKRDSERRISPLRRPDEAADLDTTGMDFEEQVEAIVSMVRSRWTGSGGGPG
ncbi:MAG: (d)CMP kinase, partial [Gemmatimonadetes bacterium]|nr:(d)CMP kinase [Gemmatimonadota bacterium]